MSKKNQSEALSHGYTANIIFLSGILRPNLHIGVKINVRPSYVNVGIRLYSKVKHMKIQGQPWKQRLQNILLKVNSHIIIEVATEKRIGQNGCAKFWSIGFTTPPFCLGLIRRL